jgi:hypothetical protein
VFQPNKCIALAASCLIALSSLAHASSETVNLERYVLSLAVSQDYRAASAAAYRLALTQNSHGNVAGSCASLAKSLEYYRKALAKEPGEPEPAVAHINDDSDGMAEVRAKFGCRRS